MPVHYLTPLASTPDWQQFEAYQDTITRFEFQKLLEEVYAPGNASEKIIRIYDTFAEIQMAGTATFRLRFAPLASQINPPRYWRDRKEWQQTRASTTSKPLYGLKIVLDPGHLGGEWAQIERRYFRVGNTSPVLEGDMTLKVALILEKKLTALGAQVFLVRSNADPVTKERPLHLQNQARQALKNKNILNPRETYLPNDANPQESVQWQSEILFYRVSEIRARAEKVNQEFKPDLTLCLHFNAEEWGDPNNPQLTDDNHQHLLIHGSYTADELSYEDVRFEMLLKLLNRSYSEELALAEVMAQSLSYHLRLRAPVFPGGVVVKVGQSPYLWARNLLANRLYQSPVLYFEPYVMNSREVFERVQAGDYEGERLIRGKLQKSLYHEYADAVVDGLLKYYLNK